MIRAFLVTLLTFLYILIAGPPVLVYAALTGNSVPVYKTGQCGARMALWLAGVRVELGGLDRIPRGRPVVFMANHQSNCDPPALLASIPPVLVLAKKEFFRVPILGRAMTVCGFIPVNRKNREQAFAAVEKAVAALKAGHSFAVYPEGTRSPDGRLQSFKKGVFLMALEAGVPIVPVSISGGRRIMPKERFAIYPGRVRITLQDPVPTQGLTHEDRDALIQRVRQAILAGLEPDEWPRQEL
jgi:1-acyl-sn-glycerol-3-phosphate acyltransferase